MGEEKRSSSHSHEGQGGGLGIRVEQQYQFASCLHRQIAVDKSACVRLEGLATSLCSPMLCPSLQSREGERASQVAC